MAKVEGGREKSNRNQSMDLSWGTSRQEEYDSDEEWNLAIGCAWCAIDNSDGEYGERRHNFAQGEEGEVAAAGLPTLKGVFHGEGELLR